MKTTRKLLSVLLALVMVLGLATVAMAQTVSYTGEGADQNNGAITIKNAAKGETYKVVKLFDATVSADKNIAYTGNIPESLTSIFTKTEGGNIVLVGADTGKTALTETDIAALKAWAETQTPIVSAESNGEVLMFDKLPYGYYVILSTQNNGAAITVNSTKPTVEVIDKNISTINPGKKVNGENETSANFGEELTYTLTTTTVNFLNETVDGEIVSHKVVQYEIQDTLPDWLENVTVTGIKVTDKSGDHNLTVEQFDNSTEEKADPKPKSIIIPWINDKTGDHLYSNGATITITYTANLKENAVIGGDGNKNDVTIVPYVDSENGPDPWDETYKEDAVVKTYGVAMLKVDNKGNALAGAEFTIDSSDPTGLKVEAVKGQPGVYRVTTGTGATTLVTDGSGYLVILGMKEGQKVTLKETKAPDGYVLQTETKTLTAILMSAEEKITSTTVWYDANGDVTNEEAEVVSTETQYNTLETLKNKATGTTDEAKALQFINVPGSELPSTGGIGTTIFYVVGAILVLGAGVLLVTKKRIAKR